MSCFGNQPTRKGYEEIPEDSGSTLPPSTTFSGSTDHLTPSTATSASASGNLGGASVGEGAVVVGAVGGPLPTAAVKPAPREKSSDRLRSRRSNVEALGFPHHHHQKDTVLCPTCRGQGKVPKEKVSYGLKETDVPLFSFPWHSFHLASFLDAPSHLFMRLCPSVRPSVRMSRVIFEGERNAY